MTPEQDRLWRFVMHKRFGCLTRFLDGRWDAEVHNVIGSAWFRGDTMDDAVTQALKALGELETQP
jgi:hypothetical protein